MLPPRLRRPLLVAVAIMIAFAGRAAARDAKDQLPAEEQKVLTHLLEDWGNDYSVTSVDIALRSVKVADTDDRRFRIGSYVKAHPELHEVIRRWGWVTLVLTPDEKLVARALVNAERDGKPAPSVAEIAAAVGTSEDQVKRGLAMLARYEIIRRDASRKGAGYKVESRYITWEPRLDFLFHQVTLEGGRQFNTN